MKVGLYENVSDVVAHKRLAASPRPRHIDHVAQVRAVGAIWSRVK
jgi:hypothetical protein